MKKRILFLAVLIILLLTSPITALAEDLTIDIDAIDQMDVEGRQRAITVRRGIDVFSESAAMVSEASETRFQSRQDTVVSGLFHDEYELVQETGEERILRITEETGLFSEPMHFDRITLRGRSANEQEPTPIWMILVVFLGVVGIGCFITYSVIISRKESKSDVHYINN